MPQARFTDKAVVVTGAASGIGRATALRLAAEGARLALADRDLDGACSLADEIARGTDSEPAAIAFEARDAASAAAMIGAARERLGRLDAVLNIAGSYAPGHFSEISAEAWEDTLSVNLTGVFHVLQAALPALVASRGAVVNTASLAALEGIAYGAAYAAAKAGLIALTKSVAIEYAPRGVRVNAVCPGGVHTAMTAGLAPIRDADPALLMRRPKLPCRDGRGEPEDVAAAFAFLASDDARFITGSVLVVDGGQRLG